MVVVSVVDVVSIGGEAISGREGARLSVRRNECVLPGASSYRVTLVRSYSLTRGQPPIHPQARPGMEKYGLCTCISRKEGYCGCLAII